MKVFCVIAAVILSLIVAMVPIPGTDVWYPQFVAVMFFGMLMIGLSIGEMSVALGLLFIYCVFSATFINHQDMMSLMCLVQMAGCLLIAKEISKFNNNQRKKIWIAIGWLLALQVIWGIVQFLNIDPIFKLSNNPKLCDTVGFSGSHNQYGLMLAGASPVAWFFPVAVPFIFIAIILSKTFTASLGLLSAWGFLLRKRLNIFFIAFVACLLCLMAVSLTHKNLGSKYSERLFIWQTSVQQVLSGSATIQIQENVNKIVTCNPLVGFGFQKFFAISPYAQMANKKWHETNYFEHAHNDYVEALFDLGIIGFGLVLFVLGEIFFLFNFPFSMSRKGSRSIGFELAAAGLIAYGVCALSIYTVHTAYNGFFLCVLLGLYYGEVNDGQKRKSWVSTKMVEGR